MIPLQKGQAIGGIAGTAAAVSYTLFGEGKIIFQGVLPSSATQLYKAHESEKVTRIQIANLTALSVSGIVFYAGDGMSAHNQIFGSLTIPANATAVGSETGWKVTDGSGKALTNSESGLISLSGSTMDKPIPVAATATPGTLIHTSKAEASGYDALTLWASNVTGVAATLTVEWGGVTDPGNHLVKGYSIAANSLPVAIATGQIMRNGLIVRAFSGTASAINITGYVEREA